MGDQWCADRLYGFGGPESHFSVLACRAKSLSARTEGQRGDLALMCLLHLAERTTIVDARHHYRAVCAARSEAAPVVAECERRYSCLVACRNGSEWALGD